MMSHPGKNNSIGSTSKNSGSAANTGPRSLDAQRRRDAFPIRGNLAEVQSKRHIAPRRAERLPDPADGSVGGLTGQEHKLERLVNVACDILGGTLTGATWLCRTSRGTPRSVPSDDMRQSPQSVVCLPGSWEYRSDVRIKRHDNAALRVPRSVLVRPSPAEVVLGKEFVDCDVSGGLLSFCSLHTPSAQSASPSAR